ncbi:hypothetical protein A9179_18690 [Pseudomonas alcaligenes]|uniref:DUF4345 domain-containing protein n=1 Tax=Aquipseudomonas alcaligenes TaxID=43263 RepID=A0ABR7S775_AQUAC|nr:DUF4345 family protein [Pseudomonas alcaligenes]MBC9252303.1 hypothetical protein [Pseudomonas alcaligenes]
MLFVRILLAAQALILAGFGLAYFIQPHQLANLSGMLLMETAAITDVRAYYGGLQLGLGLWLLLALLRAELQRPALMLLVLLYASLFAARLGGLWLDGGAQQTFNLYAMLFEGVSAGLAFQALRTLRG